VCVPSYKSVEGEAEMIELKVFYEKDFQEVNFEELKQIVTDAIKERSIES